MSRAPLADALREAQLVVCIGRGGVGKTTIAAALALEAARRGRRTLVLTVDPARRLAQAFGRETIGAEPEAVDLGGLAEGATAAPARLDMMMLSTRHAFDRLVDHLTSDESIRRSIRANRIYQHLAESLAGSHEYAAMAEIDAQRESGRYDLIVVDTPPAEHALDFLHAPRRLERFLESRFFKSLVQPAMSASRFSLRLFAVPIERALGLLERIAGIEFLTDLSELLRALDGLGDELARRASAAHRTLFGPGARYVLVARAQAGSRPATAALLDDFEALGIRPAALVVNRVAPWPSDVDPETLLARSRGPALEADCAALAARLLAGPASASPADREAAPSEIGAAPAARRVERVVEAILETARARALEGHRLDALGIEARERAIPHLPVREQDDAADPASVLAAIADQLVGPA